MFMEKLGDLLQKKYKQLDINLKLTESIIKIYYKDIVGPEIYKISNPICIKGKTLFIGVKNSVWAHHLLFFKEEIIKKINSKFKKKIIKDLKFMVSDEECKEELNNNEDYYTEINLSEFNLPKEKIMWIEKVCSNVTDKMLKKKLKEVMKKDAIYKMHKR